MRYLAVLLTLTAAASATILHRKSARPVFAVTNFYVAADSKAGNSYALDVYATPGKVPSVSCHVGNYVAGGNAYCSGAPPVPGFQSTACNTTGWSWSFSPSKSPTEPPQDGFILQLNHTKADGSIDTGCYFVNQNKFVCAQESSIPGEKTEYYNSSHSFNITTSGSNTCRFF